MSSSQRNEGTFGNGLNARHTSAHARRRASTHAAFVLRRLSPGMRLLDCGCGPGSITTGLAEAVAPGITVGIDVESAVLPPSGGAPDAGVVSYAAADIYALPFAEGTFDVVFAHAMLQHLAEPVPALREMRRVLKSGGMIGVADADYDGSLIAPDDGQLAASMRLLAQLRTRSGVGDAYVGKHLRKLLLDAGFVRAEASARADAHGTDDDVRRTGDFWARYFESPELISRVTKAGLASGAEMRVFAGAWAHWGAEPGAFWATFWCEASAWK